MTPIYRCNTGFDKGIFEGSACAFGVFDGVHKAHQELIKRTVALAQGSGGKSIVLTFDIDPDEVFHPDRLKKLMTNRERLQTLSESGVDAVVVLSFTPALYSLHPQDFLYVVFGDIAPLSIHVGENLHFGARAQGDVADLAAWAHSRGTQLVTHPLIEYEGAAISSTRIRHSLEKGDLAQAQKLLGHTYQLSGIVEPGRQDGRRFGFRTANLTLPPLMMAIGNGVYAARACVDNTWYRAAVNVGVAPTFESSTHANVEVHLLDYSGDLYGQLLIVEFVEWLREERKFTSIDELIATVQDNIHWVRNNVSLPVE